MQIQYWKIEIVIIHFFHFIAVIILIICVYCKYGRDYKEETKRKKHITRGEESISSI